MGGDEGLRVTIAGVALARRRHPTLTYALYGDEPQIVAALKNHPNLSAVAEVIHTDRVVAATDKPTQALRQSRGSSMGLAIQAVKDGTAGAAVSAGNTGALMAMAKLALRTLPASTARHWPLSLPTLGDNDVVMLDLGANNRVRGAQSRRIRHHGRSLCAHGARPRQAARAPAEHRQRGAQGHRRDPRRRRDPARRARSAAQLRRLHRRRQAGLGRGGRDRRRRLLRQYRPQDRRGTARFVTDVLRNAFTSSLRSKIGFLISKPAMHLLRHHLDPNNHNGAVFLGLNALS